MDLKNRLGVNSINLAPNEDQGWPFVNTIMKLWVPQEAGDLNG